MSFLRHDPRRVAAFLLAVIILTMAGIGREAAAQSKAAASRNAVSAAQSKNGRIQLGKQKDEYHRPEPIKPLKPQIPSEPRQRPDKVFLEKADSMIKLPQDFRDRQIVTGNVQFRQMGMWLFCDSAYYYPEENSLDAFGHVKMQQGDTLFVYADKIFYDGNSRFAKLRNGPSRANVELINRNASLTTDSLDYDLIQERGWYSDGGTLKDPQITLTSTYGSYSPRTKDAEFFYDVVLKGNKNDFTLYTDTLYYNTASHIANIVTRTRIITTEDEIITNRGDYNTQTGRAELLSRSTVLHTDSLYRTTTLEGDSIVYDPETHITRAYRYRDRLKRGQATVITDTARKAILIGGFGYYNDLTREAMATEYPLLMEYSRGDTLFLRADTILTLMLPYPQNDSIQRNINSEDSTWHYARAFPNARFFRSDVQGVADTIIYTQLDSLLRMKRFPVAWNEERQVRGDSITIHMQDSTADWARIYGHAKMMEHVEEDYYDQLHSDLMRIWFDNGQLKRLEAEGSVETIMLPQESDSTYNRLVTAESSFLTIDMIPDKNDIDKLVMWPEVSGTVTPLFLVKKSQKLLNGAVWLEAIRPRRQWYGDKVRWEDDLGEVPEELINYLRDGQYSQPSTLN